MKIPEHFFGYSFIYYGMRGKFIPSRQLTYNRKQIISRLEYMSRLKSFAPLKRSNLYVPYSQLIIRFINDLFNNIASLPN